MKFDTNICLSVAALALVQGSRDADEARKLRRAGPSYPGTNRYGWNKPAYGYGQPAYGYGQPAYGYGQPAYGYGQNNGYGSNNPAYGSGQNKPEDPLYGSIPNGAENIGEPSLSIAGEPSVDGEWGPMFNMKLIPIHAMLLPDGNVLSYGTDIEGEQRADLYYQIWDISKGAIDSAHMLLQHFTKTDIFCSTMNVDPSSGNIIIMGGDTRIPANDGINTVLEFDKDTYDVRRHPMGDMHYARWYASSINLPNGDILVVGGSGQSFRGSPIPEVYSPGLGFRPLYGAEVPNMSHGDNWFYPYIYVNSSGEIICIMPTRYNKDIYRISVEGDGSIEKIGTKPFTSHRQNPSVMFRTDRVLFVDDDGGLWVADISDRAPVWTKTNDLGSSRTNGCFVIMPDGRVAIVGGANTPNTGGDVAGNNLDHANYAIDIWDPTTYEVHAGPLQDLARLYHSTALFLPNGSVLSQGGGAPGPLNNRNGQIYFPNFLFDEDGEPQVEASSRPSILVCPRNVVTDGSFVIEVNDARAVDKVTATKSGATTHTRNFDTRWLDLSFKVLNDNEVQVFTEGRDTMIPGLWMLNTIDGFGVPSEGSLLGVDMAPL